MSGMFSSARLLRHVLTVLTMVPTPDSATVNRAQLAIGRRPMRGLSGNFWWNDDPMYSHPLETGELRTPVVPPVYDSATQSPTSLLFSHRQCLRPTGTTTPLDHATQSPPSSLLAKKACFHPSDSDSDSDSDPTVDRDNVDSAAPTIGNDMNYYNEIYNDIGYLNQQQLLNSFGPPSTVTSFSASTSTHASTTTTLYFSSAEYHATSIPLANEPESNDAASYGFMPAWWPFDFTRLLLLLFYAIYHVSSEFVFGKCPSSWLATCVDFVCFILIGLIIYSVDSSRTMAISILVLREWLDYDNGDTVLLGDTRRILKVAFTDFSIFCTYLPALFGFKDPLDILRPVLVGGYARYFDTPKDNSSKSGYPYHTDCYSTSGDSENKGLSKRSQFDISLWLETGSSVFERSACLSSMTTPQPLHVSPPPSPSSSSSISEPSLTFSDSTFDTSCSSSHCDESDCSTTTIEDSLADVDSARASKKHATTNKKGTRKTRSMFSQSGSLRSGETMDQVAAANHRKWISMRSVLSEDVETDVQPTCSREDAARPPVHEARAPDAKLKPTAIEPTTDGDDDWTPVCHKKSKSAATSQNDADI